MITNASMTIYNRVKNEQTGFYDYIRHFIPNVHWYTDQKTVVKDGSIQSADVYKIRIPEEELNGYVSPAKYSALAKKNGTWTVENQDLFVKGSGPAEVKSVADLSKLHLEYGSVDSWSDNRFGGLPHIRIGGSV